MIEEHIPFAATRMSEHYADLGRLPVRVVLHDIRSLYNVGAFFRTADAVQLDRLCLSGITGHPPPTRQLPRRRSDPKITSRGRCVASRCRTWSACAGRGMRWQRSRRAQPLSTFLTGGRYFQSFSASGTKSMGSALIFSLAAIDTCDCQCAGLNIRSMWQRPAASCSSNSCVDTGNYDRSRVRPW